MNKVSYLIPRLNICKSGALNDATAEELRVLLALIEFSGEIESEEMLANLCDIKEARCSAALVMWEKMGVIVKSDTPCQKNLMVSEEFAGVYKDEDIEEHASKEVAESIRNEDIAGALEECARLMQKTALSTHEIKLITLLITDYDLSAEYVINLTAYLATLGRATPVKLRDMAKKLSSKGIDSVEALEAYIRDRENTCAAEWEYRKVIGIYDRNLSITEKELFKKWSEKFGYSVGVVEFAFDTCIKNKSRVSIMYMDKVLSTWHKAGCKELADCKSYSEQHKPILPDPITPTPKKSEAPKPRYGDFDINEAFKHALSRSFGDED